MTKILFLDDDPQRHVAFQKFIAKKGLTDTTELHACFTAQEAIELLKNNEYDAIHLDHDLGGKIYVEEVENTGYEVALWIRDHLESLPNLIIIHTYNPAGAERMMNVLKERTSNVFYIPFNYY